MEEKQADTENQSQLIGQKPVCDRKTEVWLMNVGGSIWTSLRVKIKGAQS